MLGRGIVRSVDTDDVAGIRQALYIRKVGITRRDVGKCRRRALGKPYPRRGIFNDGIVRLYEPAHKIRTRNWIVRAKRAAVAVENTKRRQIFDSLRSVVVREIGERRRRAGGWCLRSNWSGRVGSGLLRSRRGHRGTRIMLLRTARCDDDTGCSNAYDENRLLHGFLPTGENMLT